MLIKKDDVVNITNIKAIDLPDAWFQALYNIRDSGRVYTIDRGSFEKQQRLEYNYITIHITNPGTRPLLPSIPQHLNIPDPVSEDYLNTYIDYVMGDCAKRENEVYTYADYIKPQMIKVINMFKNDGPNTNQATIAIGNIDSIDNNDPECLRLIDCRIQDNKLHFVVYFRSNDLWSGFPANLAAIQLLKEYMAAEIGVADGEIIYSSKGLHLYDYTWPLAAKRTGLDFTKLN